MGQRNPAPVNRWFPLFIGIQPSFWWRRIFSIPRRDFHPLQGRTMMDSKPVAAPNSSQQRRPCESWTERDDMQNVEHIHGNNSLDLQERHGKTPAKSCGGIIYDPSIEGFTKNSKLTRNKENRYGDLNGMEVCLKPQIQSDDMNMFCEMLLTFQDLGYSITYLTILHPYVEARYTRSKQGSMINGCWTNTSPPNHGTWIQMNCHCDNKSPSRESSQESWH